MRSLSRTLFLLLGSVSGCLTLLGAAQNAGSRPNILFIVADDLGWSDLGCYGSTFYETPHLDQLAREGVRFSQAYSAASVCSPTRASLMTGKFPVRTGVTDYIPGLSPKNRKLVTQRTKTELALEEFTVGEAFRDGGYQTAYIGKWHLGGKGFEPSEQGFDYYVGSDELHYDKSDWRMGERIANATVEFLAKRNSGKPFIACVNFHEPHTPMLEYPDYIGHFKRKAAGLPALTSVAKPEHDGLTRLRQDDPAYASEVAGLDSFVGTILAAIDKAGLREQTIVVFFSDNGGLSTLAKPGPTSNAPLRAGKGWLYEGGIRVPLIVRGPGIGTLGKVIDQPVISADFYPTFLSLAGLPARNLQHLDGMSFTPLLRGDAELAQRTFYWHYPHYHGSTWGPGSAIREGNWKLIVQDHYATVELYDLASDIGETNDLSSHEIPIRDRLLKKLRSWQTETNAYIPTEKQSRP